MCGQHHLLRLLWRAFLHDFPRLFNVIFSKGERIIKEYSVEEVLVNNKAAVSLSLG